EALDLDGGQLARAALRQPGGADVARKHVRIAVDAERLLLAGILGIVPSARRQLHHALTDLLGQRDRRETGAALIEEPHNVAIGDAASRRVGRMHPHDLAAPMLQRAAVATEVELTVEPRRRLIGNQSEWPPTSGVSVGVSQVGWAGQSA